MNLDTYRRSLHNVRRVTNEDFVNGYRIQVGSFVARAGSWDNKGVVTKVHAEHLRKGNVTKTDWCGVHIEVLFIGHYFSEPSVKQLSETIHTYVPISGTGGAYKVKEYKRSKKSQMRFFGKRFVPAAKRSITKTTIWFDKDNRIQHADNGWVLVVPA